MNRQDDFANRYEAAARQLFERIERACAAEVEWPQGVRAAIETALRFLVAEPAAAQLLFFEPYEIGGEAELRHEATLARLEELLRAGREQIDVQSMPAMVEESMIGGLVFIVARALRAGEPDLLPALGPELTALLLTPYLGHEEAERVAGLSE